MRLLVYLAISCVSLVWDIWVGAHPPCCPNAPIRSRWACIWGVAETLCMAAYYSPTLLKGLRGADCVCPRQILTLILIFTLTLTLILIISVITMMTSPLFDNPPDRTKTRHSPAKPSHGAVYSVSLWTLAETCDIKRSTLFGWRRRLRCRPRRQVADATSTSHSPKDGCAGWTRRRDRGG